MKVDNVINVESTDACGAGIRRLDWARENFLMGTCDWQTVSYEFEITEDLRYVELVIELHARFGRLQVDAGTLKLSKMQEQVTPAGRDFRQRRTLFLA